MNLKTILDSTGEGTQTSNVFTLIFLGGKDNIKLTSNCTGVILPMNLP